MSDPMSDPFRTLRGAVSPVDPDDTFVESVMREVEARLGLPMEATAPRTHVVLTDVAVGPTVTISHPQRSRRFWVAAAAAAAVAVVAGTLAIGAGDERDPVATLPGSGPVTDTSSAVSTPSLWVDLEPGATAPLPPAPIPAHNGAAMVWTGAELIVWGGLVDEPQCCTDSRDGAAFDPAIGTWRQIAQAPAGVEPGAVIWTGTEMLAFGVRQGARSAAYDPAGDTWRTITDPPSAGSVAFWIGDNAVLLGDPDVGSPPLAYDPATDEWRGLAGGPSSPSAVWTGTTIITVTDTDEVTGAEISGYDPATDTWRVLEGIGTEVHPVVLAGRDGAAPTVAFLPTETRTALTLTDDRGSPVGEWAGRPAELELDCTRPDDNAGCLLNSFEAVALGGEVLFWHNGTGWAFNPLEQSWRSFPLDGRGPAWDGTEVVAAGDLLFAWGAGRDGLVYRSAASNPPPATAPASALGTSGGMWPQSTLDEVRAAQELADAGDPAYTWQLDAALAADQKEPWDSEVLARFIEEELGWEEFISGALFSGFLYVPGDYLDLVFIRCANGQTNPLSPLYPDAPATVRGCAPTIDELTYETVSFRLTQPERRGPSGIWVVNRWEILPSEPHPGTESVFGVLGADFGGGQVEQVVPPSDAEVTAVLDAFLRARVAGEGAAQYLLLGAETLEYREVPLLYATTSGDPYERSEIERVRGPVWPHGWMEYEVRLFADDETVVEQYFHVGRHDGQLGLVYGFASDYIQTRENGQAVALPQREFGDTLTFTAPPSVPRGDGIVEIALTGESDGRVIIGTDPRGDGPGCESGPGTAPATDAEALARSIAADPAFETNEPVPVQIAGIDGLQMDVVFSEQGRCFEDWPWPRERLTAGDPGWRMRLYLLDYPPTASNFRPEVLAIAVIASETSLERAVEDATPIVESFEFQAINS